MKRGGVVLVGNVNDDQMPLIFLGCRITSLGFGILHAVQFFSMYFGRNNVGLLSNILNCFIRNGCCDTTDNSRYVAG